MITCPNCGAKIENDAIKCPYCGYINKEGAEKKFRSDIDEIKDNIEEAKKELPKTLAKGLKSGTKVIFITIGVIIIIAIVLALELAREMKDSPKEFLTAEEQAYASAYKAEASKELSQAYEDKDIEKMAEIFDTAYSVDRVSLWGIDHYESGQAASNYLKLKQCLPNLSKEKIKKREAEEITYYCFWFYYKSYGEDGAELFDPIRENEIIPIILTRLGYTIEDMEDFRDKVMDPPYVNRTKLYRETKGFYVNYH